MIVATDLNGVIGVGNKLPWNVPAEMQHFKRETMGQNVLMGRKTWESIPEKYRPLTGRNNIVLSFEPDSVEGCDEVVNCIPAARSLYTDLTIIGGASIYGQFLQADLIDVIKVSVIDLEVPDSPDNVMLPDIELDRFEFIGTGQHDGFVVLTYHRRT